MSGSGQRKSGLRAFQAAARSRRRLGLSVLEIVMSFTLLSAALTFSAPLVVRHWRLLAEQRDYRLALDELSNQLERLTTLPAGELAAAMEQLTPSAFIADRLPGVTLQGDVETVDAGEAITLRLRWNDGPRSAAPVKLAGWIVRESKSSSATEQLE